MFKPLREMFVPRTQEETYLHERLRSARTMGWDMRPTPRVAIRLHAVNLNTPGTQAAGAATADGLPSHPSASGEPA